MLSHASRQFKDHEANYPPFLIDMAKAIYRMDTFDQYLPGQPFILYMDDQPQPELTRRHTLVFTLRQSSTTSSSRSRLGSEYPFTSAPPCRLRSMPWLRTTPSYCKLKKMIWISSSSKSFGCLNNGHRLSIQITKSYWMISIATFSSTNMVPLGSTVQDGDQMSPRSKHCIFLSNIDRP